MSLGTLKFFLLLPRFTILDSELSPGEWLEESQPQIPSPPPSPRQHPMASQPKDGNTTSESPPLPDPPFVRSSNLYLSIASHTNKRGSAGLDGAPCGSFTDMNCHTHMEHGYIARPLEESLTETLATRAKCVKFHLVDSLRDVTCEHPERISVVKTLRALPKGTLPGHRVACQAHHCPSPNQSIQACSSLYLLYLICLYLTPCL